MNIDNPTIIILCIVSANLMLLIIAIMVLYVIWRKTKSLDLIHENNILEASREIFKRMEHINRWQRLTARMIKDDREALKAHESGMVDIRAVAYALKKKFLDES